MSLLTWMPKRLNLFWQIVLAFLVTSIVVSIGLVASARHAFWRLEQDLQSNPSPQTELWHSRLSRYYGAAGGWEGVEAMVDAYPVGEDWAPWDEAWQPQVVLADAGGRVLVSPEPGRAGKLLHPIERAWALPIEGDGATVGYLLMPFTVPLPLEGLSGELWPRRLDFVRRALQRFLITEFAIIMLGLVLGAVLSRRIARPMADLTTATHAIAGGDLTARVRERYPGELGELAASFNRMASALERADGLRRTMTADVAHELRTPLSVIRGKLEGILDGVYPATADHLNPVLEETELLTQLVEDLRVLALAEAGQLALEMQRLDVGDLLRDTRVNFTPQAQDRGIALEVEALPDLPVVQGDWRRIAQVLGNLVTNALRHTPEGGTITLAAAEVEGGVWVTVTDTGSGIPPEDLPFVFERFWRRDPARERLGGREGSGLGLAIARELVALHGGELTVVSTVGEGSVFGFGVPRDGSGVSGLGRVPLGLQ